MTLVDLKVGQVFTLTQEDWDSVKTKRTKNHNQRFGMAIDHHVKKIALATGASIPEDQYAPYDFLLGSTYFDIKSYGTSSVSISDRELAFARQCLNAGNNFEYMVFRQRLADQFEFDGSISLADLLSHQKVYPSQYSGVYFSVGQVRKLFQ